MPRVSLASVAAALRISTMTVSRALRGKPGVSPELAARVAAAAKRLGYRPDPEIGRLMHYLRQGKKTGLRASLCGLTDFPQETEPAYCTRLHRRAAEHARALGFAFSVVRIDSSPKGLGSALRSIRARGVEGILLLPMVAPTAFAAEGWEPFSVVAATSSVTAPHFHEVVPNHAANARLLVERLAARGFRRIGLIELESHAERTREALPAALAWHDARLRVRCAPLFYRDDALPDVAAWARHERPEVVVVSHPPHLPRFRATLEAAGLRVQWALGNSRGFCDLAPGLDERDDLIGIAAIDTLSSLVIRGERGIPPVPTSIAIAGQWVEEPAPQR